jgi:hypothetical protein
MSWQSRVAGCDYAGRLRRPRCHWAGQRLGLLEDEDHRLKKLLAPPMSKPATRTRLPVPSRFRILTSAVVVPNCKWYRRATGDSANEASELKTTTGKTLC